MAANDKSESLAANDHAYGQISYLQIPRWMR